MPIYLADNIIRPLNNSAQVLTWNHLESVQIRSKWFHRCKQELIQYNSVWIRSGLVLCECTIGGKSDFGNLLNSNLGYMYQVYGILKTL